MKEVTVLLVMPLLELLKQHQHQPHVQHQLGHLPVLHPLVRLLFRLCPSRPPTLFQSNTSNSPKLFHNSTAPFRSSLDSPETWDTATTHPSDPAVVVNKKSSDTMAPVTSWRNCNKNAILNDNRSTCELFWLICHLKIINLLFQKKKT